jgi:hypothetical protein
VKGGGGRFWGGFSASAVTHRGGKQSRIFALGGLKLTERLNHMAKDSDIVLLRDSYSIKDITTPECREKLSRTLADMDHSSFTELELRRYFTGLKIAMGAFIQKVGILETNILDLRRDQVAAEARMEAMYLKAQLEIQSLRSEISEIRLSKGRINQIVKVAKALQGNAYAPYAVKSLVEGVVGKPQQNSKVAKLDTTKLPSDFTNRLEFAEQNGFKWNQNNRIPSKASKQIEILEEWENQFCEVEKLTMSEVLDKTFVGKIGPGAVAGALMLLERELGALLPERKTHSVFNCYQKAIKLYNDRAGRKALPAQSNFDAKSLIMAAFCNLPDEDIEDLVKRLETRVLGTTEQAVSAIKKMVSRSILPAFINYAEEDDSDTEKLYAIQSGKYDSQLGDFVSRYELNRQESQSF